MRKLTTFAALLTGLTLLGCGDATSSKPIENEAPEAPAGGFILTADPVSVSPGGSTELVVQIVMGEGFSSDVEVTFEPPTGLTVNPKTYKSAADEAQATTTVSAPAGTALGDLELQVKAKPPTGNEVTKKITVKVVPEPAS